VSLFFKVESDRKFRCTAGRKRVYVLKNQEECEKFAKPAARPAREKGELRKRARRQGKGSALEGHSQETTQGRVKNKKKRS